MWESIGIQTSAGSREVSTNLLALGLAVITRGDEACFLNALDLSHTAFVDGDVDRAKAEICDVLPDNF